MALKDQLTFTTDWPDSIPGWVSWVFAWLGSSSRVRRQMFGAETGAMAQCVGESLTHELSATDIVRLEAGVQAWISGSPLSAIERVLGTDAQGTNRTCIRARNLVTKAVPLSVTFAVGVVALVAKGIERPMTPGAELALDCLVQGVREGFDKPALIAYAHVEGRRSLRVSKHQHFTQHPGLSALEALVSSLDDLIPLVRGHLAEA
ncbi:hypothetical protein [Microbacterium lacticum]